MGVLSSNLRTQVNILQMSVLSSASKNKLTLPLFLSYILTLFLLIFWSQLLFLYFGLKYYILVSIIIFTFWSQILFLILLVGDTLGFFNFFFLSKHCFPFLC